MVPKRVEPGPGQESVWDYPRPPRLEPVERPLRIEFAGQTIAATTSGYRVLETSHPPVYYFPSDDVRSDLVVPTSGGSFCEWKGMAAYHSIVVGDREVVRGAWSYPTPTKPFAAIKDHIAFYAGPMDGCFVGDEQARPQPGGFYGGWITDDVVGPFKGEPGTRFW